MLWYRTCQAVIAEAIKTEATGLCQAKVMVKMTEAKVLWLRICQAQAEAKRV